MMPKLKVWAYVRSLTACAFGLGTWAAFGTVALYGPETSPRLALPGSVWTLIVAAIAAFAYLQIRRPSTSDAAPLWLPAIALLPWLPLPIPPAVLLWTGPLARALVVVAIAGVLLSPFSRDDARAEARAYARSLGKGIRLLWRRGFSPAMWWPTLSPALAFVLAAALISGTLYLILDLDAPFTGPIQVSSAPLERVLAEMRR